MLAVQVCNPGIAMILTLVVSHTVVVCLSVCIPVLAAMTDIYIYIYIIYGLFSAAMIALGTVCAVTKACCEVVEPRTPVTPLNPEALKPQGKTKPLYKS